jgi:hypothetical protein
MGLQAIIALSLFYIIPVHRCTRTRILSLRWSYPDNGFIRVSLSLNSRMKSSGHSLIPFLPFPAAANSEYSTQLLSDYCSLLLQLLTSEFDCLIIPHHGPRSTENTACIVDEACLPRRCLTIEVLLSLVRVFRECVKQTVA